MLFDISHCWWFWLPSWHATGRGYHEEGISKGKGRRRSDDYASKQSFLMDKHKICLRIFQDLWHNGAWWQHYTPLPGIHEFVGGMCHVEMKGGGSLDSCCPACFCVMDSRIVHQPHTYRKHAQRYLLCIDVYVRYIVFNVFLCTAFHIVNIFMLKLKRVFLYRYMKILVYT